MYLINGTYFKDRIFIPNQEELLGTSDEVERYVDEYVPLLLQEILGFDLFSDLDQYVLPEIVDSIVLGSEDGQVIATDGQTEIVLDFEPVTFLMFRNGIFQSPGTDYELSGNTVTFAVPLDENDVIDFLGSTIADTTGTALTLNPSAPQKWKDLVDGKTYQVDGKNYRWRGLIFQQGVKKVSLLAEFVYSQWVTTQNSVMTGLGNVVVEGVNTKNVSIVDNYVQSYNSFVEMYQGDTKGGYVSLKQFLKDNSTAYPDAALPCFDYQNSFGI